MNPLGIIIHALRLRRVRWAFAALNRRLDVYEQAYGTGAVHLADEDLKAAGLRRERG